MDSLRQKAREIVGEEAAGAPTLNLWAEDLERGWVVMRGAVEEIWSGIAPR